MRTDADGPHMSANHPMQNQRLGSRSVAAKGGRVISPSKAALIKSFASPTGLPGPGRQPADDPARQHLHRAGVAVRARPVAERHPRRLPPAVPLRATAARAAPGGRGGGVAAGDAAAAAHLARHQRQQAQGPAEVRAAGKDGRTDVRGGFSSKL